MSQSPLEPFITSHIKARQTAPARPPKLVTCLQVERVAAVSVAGHAGIVAGDLLVFLDGSPASKADPKLYKHRSTKRLYTFYSQARAEQIELACTGIEIGVELAYTTEAIKARFKPAACDVTALAELWANKAPQVLLELSTAALAHPGNDESPAVLFEGVGMWEAGRHQEGLARIQKYQREFAKNWTMNFAAIGMHYQGLELLRVGKRDAAVERFNAAFAYDPQVRTADEIEKLTGERPPMHVSRWTGAQWPANYRLPMLEGGPGQVSLADALSAMNDGQLQLVCLLATYRSNGPYGEFLQRWLNYVTWFGPLVNGLHVLTMAPQRYQDHGVWYQIEDTARAAGRFALLLDEGGAAHAPLEQNRSPLIFALDRRGTIRYEGGLDSVDLWETLAALP